VKNHQSFSASHPFGMFLVRRLASLVFLAFGISLVAFTLTSLVPGDPVLSNLGELAASNPDIVRAYKERYGLDKPLPEQYVLYLLHLAHGDLGVSEQSQRPVSADLAQYIPASTELAVAATVLAVLVGVIFGLLAAMRHNKLIDQVLRFVSLACTSIPTFWLGLLALYVFFFKLGWFPGGGRLDSSIDIPRHVTGLITVDALLAGDVGALLNALQHLAMPAVVLAAHTVGLLVRFTRAAVLDVLQEDFMNVARAKGLSQIGVLRHLLRAALPPVVTVIGFQFAEVMSGTVLVETIFGWPGIGRYAFHAATTLDLPAIMGVTIFVAIVFVIVNLVVDVLYGVIDPRLRIA
jgi:peptide/nickel transport system permease protein